MGGQANSLRLLSAVIHYRLSSRKWSLKRQSVKSGVSVDTVGGLLDAVDMAARLQKSFYAVKKSFRMAVQVSSLDENASVSVSVPQTPEESAYERRGAVRPSVSRLPWLRLKYLHSAMVM